MEDRKKRIRKGIAILMAIIAVGAASAYWELKGNYLEPESGTYIINATGGLCLSGTCRTTWPSGNTTINNIYYNVTQNVTYNITYNYTTQFDGNISAINVADNITLGTKTITSWDDVNSSGGGEQEPYGLSYTYDFEQFIGLDSTNSNTVYKEFLLLNVFGNGNTTNIVRCVLRPRAAATTTGVHVKFEYYNISLGNYGDVVHSYEFFTSTTAKGHCYSYQNPLTCTTPVNTPSTTQPTVSYYEAVLTYPATSGYLNVSIKSEVSGSNVYLHMGSYCTNTIITEELVV